MAKGVKFVLNRRAFQQQVLMGDKTAAMLEVLARAAAPSGTRVETSVSSNARNSGRARARIVDDSMGAMFREARTGHLSGAIGLAAGDAKMWYTTRAGNRRLASRAQIANWTRGR